jgi:hypothetical protein
MEDWPIQSDLPPGIQEGTYSVKNEEAYIHYILRQAKWTEPRFRKLLVSIVADLNECAKKCASARSYASQSEYIAALGVDPNMYSLRISTISGVGKDEDICGIKIAPIKDFERCLAKATSFHGKEWVEHAPAARYLCDFLRATIYAQDPYVLSIAFAMFKNRCEGLPRVSNYFIGHEHKPPETQTFINTNFRLVDPDTGTEHFAEVQFALQDFLTIKGIQHEYYEITRATSVHELLGRPFGEH